MSDETSWVGYSHQRQQDPERRRQMVEAISRPNPGPAPTGRKDDAGKLRYDLIPPECLRALAEVLTVGAAKYAADNWQIVPDARSRYTAALMRHVEAWRAGEANDRDDQLHHLAHALCNAMFLLWFDLKEEARAGTEPE